MAYIGKTPAPAALTSSDITDGIITSSKIANGGVETIDIADANVTSAKLASGVGGVAGITSSANATAMTIDSSENIGIGTASPDSIGSNITTVEITGGSTVRTGGLYLSNSDKSIKGYWYGSSTGYSFGTESNSDLKFVSSNTERVRIHSGGVMSASQGIALGVGTANTASNVLDDYEEGTWTPRVTLNGNTAPSNIAYAGSTQGVYTRVGRVVTINFHIELSNKGTGTNTPLWLSGASLPFTSSGIYSASMYTPIFINKSGQTKRGYLYGTWDSANGIKIALTD